ncbi:hypothetical protein EJB05_43176 [Eragrostis curvula]|uniref:cytokinin riboside 5'-monophosphate phosphoribohydrolase n=1 Tax=Eragrostis curvula TaxID=38414 RepID=A0A5J9TEC9_9POAL|nr:hypothetical protein EJB05_43176 [Eragrostis curvula]
MPIPPSHRHFCFSIRARDIERCEQTSRREGKSIVPWRAGRASSARKRRREAMEATNGGGEQGSRFRRVCVFCGSSSGKGSSYRDAAVELGKELVARKVGLVYGGGSLGLMGEVSEAVHKGGGHVIGVIPTTLMGKELTGETVGEVRAVADMHQRKAEMARNSDAFIALPALTRIMPTYTKLPSLFFFLTKASSSSYFLPQSRRCPVAVCVGAHRGLELAELAPKHVAILCFHARFPLACLISSSSMAPVAGGYGTLEELLEVITWAQLGIHSKPVGLLNVDGYYNLLLAFIDKAVDDGFIKPAQRHILVSAPDARGLVQKLEQVLLFDCPVEMRHPKVYVRTYVQEYESVQDETPKLRWGMEQVVYNSTPQAEIART